MNCPACSSGPEIYYFGIFGHNCSNPKCSMPGDKKVVATAQQNNSDNSSFSLENFRCLTETHRILYAIPFHENSKGICIWNHYGKFASLEIRSGRFKLGSEFFYNMVFSVDDSIIDFIMQHYGIDYSYRKRNEAIINFGNRDEAPSDSFLEELHKKCISVYGK